MCPKTNPECPSGITIRFVLSLPILVVVLSMVLEGPAAVQMAPDISSTMQCIPDKLQDDNAQEATDHIKQ